MSRMFSIDLAREIEHITRRQHLNAVQDLVLLVRRALRAGAPSVRITRRRHAVTIAYEGAACVDDELTLLFTVLGTSSDDEKHAALSRLERVHGIALLSLLVTKDDVTVRSQASFRGGGGGISMLPDVDPTTTTITYTRPPSLRRAEKRELLFYARHADVPIDVDGVTLERAPAVALLEPRAILGARLAFTDDEVLCTLVDKTRPTRVRFLDHGIFFGVRARAPNEAVPIDVVVNTRAKAFDENYRATIERSHAEVLRAEREVLELLARHPGPLDAERRRSIRAIVVALPKERLTPALIDLPLFDTVGGALLSTKEFRRAIEHRRMLLYVRPVDVKRRQKGMGWRRVLRPTPRVSITGALGRIPVLDDTEAQTIAALLHVDARQSPLGEDSLEAPSAPVPPPVDDTTTPLARFAAHLSERSSTRFRIIAGAACIIDEGSRERVVGLGDADPVVAKAAAFAKERPELLSLVEARLIGHARETTRAASHGVTVDDDENRQPRTAR